MLKRLDTRVVYGARCAWWGSIAEVASNGGLPSCPHCGSVLYEMENFDKWWSGVDRFEAAGHPGYRQFVEWTKGKHFLSFKAAAAAYKAETGIEVRL